MQNIENALCGICGTATLRTLFSAYDRRFQKSSPSFDVMECSTCRVVQTIPLLPPHELAEYYPMEYYPTGGDAEHYHERTRKFQQNKVQQVKAFRSTGKLLDIGAGVGQFVFEARESGFGAEGLEFSPTAAAHGRTRWGLTITTGDFLSFDRPASSFDVITLWQVLEHLPNPREVMRKLHMLLGPEGLLVIAVPNIASFQARIFRDRWYHLDVPRHLFHYSPESLSRLVESTGFTVRAIDHHSPEHNPAGVWCSMMRAFYPGESFFHKLVRKTVAAPAAHAAAAVEEWAKRGGTFTLFATRK